MPRWRMASKIFLATLSTPSSVGAASQKGGKQMERIVCDLRAKVMISVRTVSPARNRARLFPRCRPKGMLLPASLEGVVLGFWNGRASCPA